MAFDACFLTAVLEELRPKLLCARVEKLHQPSRDTLILHLRCAAGRERLLIAANPAAPRLHLTGEKTENPEQPPMFCMLLRKHLCGARLTELRQQPMERLVAFTFACTSELGDPTEKHLVAELMGRTCNLYLLDADGRILDCLRRVGLDSSAARPALPGLYYQPPQPVQKADPARLEEADYAALLRGPGADVLADRLMDTLGGLSPLVCREAALAAAGELDARIQGLDIPETARQLYRFFREALEHPAPWFTAGPDGTPKYFAFCPIREYGECRRAASFCALLDEFYTRRAQRDLLAQKSQGMRKTVSNLCQRLTRKLALQQQELSKARDRERLRQLGDIVTANLHRIRRGQTELLAEDLYDEAMPAIRIPLSPLLAPQQNAAKYYKDYSRMKNAEKELTHQLQLGQAELDYLGSVLEELRRARTEQELEEIRQELTQGGYLRRDPAKKRIRHSASQPLHFVSPDGFPVHVGRNNRQNDELTCHMARRDDLFLHVQKIPGSHVILECRGAVPPESSVLFAARLAAWHSQAQQGQNVPVDVTPVRHVKKPAGAKPGMVVYGTYRTVFVDPLEAPPQT